METAVIQIYTSKDNYQLQIGIAKTTKNKSSISGDSNLQIRLEDGKYLLALSDGMGSGPNAKRNSQIAIKMLKRLLMSGFDKEVSLQLINSTIFLNTTQEMYATLVANKEIKEYFDLEVKFNIMIADINKIIAEAIKDVL